MAPAPGLASIASQPTWSPTTAEIPIRRSRQRHRGSEDDHSERDDGPRQAGVERLQGRRERSTQQADRRHRLRRPRDRDHDRDRREAAREGKREPVGDEVVPRGRGGERRVAACNAGAGGPE
jgi:hypothetical protein